MEISNDLHDLDKTATKITNKIQKESNWWSRFKLEPTGQNQRSKINALLTGKLPRKLPTFQPGTPSVLFQTN